MDVKIARGLDDAVALAAERPEADLLAGGTDLLVEINFGRHRPRGVIALDRVPELRELSVAGGWQGAGPPAKSRDGRTRMGAGVTYTRMLDEPCGSEALRQAARTVGSPQIRNAGTIGGNLGTCSPAGDTLPVLAALEATVQLRSREAERSVPFAEYMTGPKKSVRQPGEVIVAAEWEDAGPAQVFMKAGTRNAMVIAISSLALVVDRKKRRVGIGLGSCGPTILRALEAERFAAGLFDEAGWERPSRPSDAAAQEFGRLVASAARPIDDVRGTAAYRRHVLGVMGARALTRVARIA